MSLQQLDIRPQQGFNQIFTELVNNVITTAPYNKQYDSKYFFLKKRKGIIDKLKKDDYKFIDYMSGFLLTIHDDDYVVLNEEGEEQVTIDGGGTANIFVKTLGGTGEVKDNGTASDGSSTTLKDEGKSRDDNELAGYYVYIRDGQGAGQIRYIKSNTSDTITVSGFDVEPNNTSEYKIYERLGDNILVPYSKGCYIYDGNEWDDAPIFSGYDIKDMIVWNGRLWFIHGHILTRSEEGDYYNLPISNDMYVSGNNVNNIFPYGSYLFVTTPENISVVYKGFSTNDGTEFYVIKEGVSQMGVKNRFGINKYRNNLYLVGTDLRLYSVNVGSVGNDIDIQLQDNGSMPANFISKYYDKDIRVVHDVNYLYLFCNDDDNTYEIYYNDLYKGWLNNEYSVIIYNKKFISSKEYVLGNEFYGVRGGYKDLDNTYGQTIKSIIGEQDIWMWKDVKYISVLLGKTDYIQNAMVKITNQIADKRYCRKYNLGNTGYISDLGDVVDSTIGGSNIGTDETGGDKSDYATTISDVDLIRINTNTVGHLLNIEINTLDGDYGILFGGIYVYYNMLNPRMKYYRNVL